MGAASISVDSLSGGYIITHRFGVRSQDREKEMLS